MNHDVIDATYIDIVSSDIESTKENRKLIFYHVIKRIFDVICASLGILFMAPITLLVKITYMLSGDFKSIFFVQKRIGKNGKEFSLYKYRTMVPDAEKVLQKMLKQKKYKDEWDKNQKFDKDPRITKMGNLLRKTSLDELPQLYNVLYNDMSMIGPRPLVKGELDSHNGNHEIYESVKPGITGWWASHGRSAVDYHDRLELEYFYVKNRGLILDIRCIIDTIKAIILKNGAK